MRAQYEGTASRDLGPVDLLHFTRSISQAARESPHPSQRADRIFAILSAGICRERRGQSPFGGGGPLTPPDLSTRDGHHSCESCPERGGSLTGQNAHCSRLLDRAVARRSVRQDGLAQPCRVFQPHSPAVAGLIVGQDPLVPGARLPAEVGRVRWADREKPGFGQYLLGRCILERGGRSDFAEAVLCRC